MPFKSRDEQLEYYRNYYKNNIQKKKRYYKKNKQKILENQIYYLYGLSSQQYEKLKSKQKDKCAICYTHNNKLKRRLYVDHSHKTGKVRGLLCSSCNKLLGFAKDNFKILEKAIIYLKEI